MKPVSACSKKDMRGRAPRGARGLKRGGGEHVRWLLRRAPRGARGLKPACLICAGSMRLSRPARGAWIETATLEYAVPVRIVAPRAGRVD